MSHVRLQVLTQRQPTKESLKKRLLHLDQTIASKEAELNAMIYVSYGLKSDELGIVFLLS
jgi:hypothetical protein